jgi:hypothetical protein
MLDARVARLEDFEFVFVVAVEVRFAVRLSVSAFDAAKKLLTESTVSAS